MEMVGVGPRCTRGADSRSTPARYSSRSTEEATPFTLVVTTSWCRTAWRSSPACARPTDDVRWLGLGYQIWGALACRRLPWLPEMVLP